MAADPNPTLRAELNAALAVIRPQIKGLIDFSKILVSPGPVVDAVKVQISVRQHREWLITDVIKALDNLIVKLNDLEKDGYPELPMVMASEEVLLALHEEADAIAYAMQIFELLMPATTMRIRLGPAADKL